MWKRHKKELIGCALTPIMIVVLLLAMVSVFEHWGIHVPGSREMWIGLIGAVLGGAFTLLGVLFSIFKQEVLENEQRRLENMPILVFELCDVKDNFDSALTYTDDGLITSGFPEFERMDVTGIRIKSANGCSVFNFTIEGCSINGKEILKTDAFNPAKIRIAPGEMNLLVFNYATKLNENIFCIIRFLYEDILGNRYYQDLPFIYMEVLMEGKRLRQFIEIRDIKQPILIGKNTKSMEKSAKEYIDYEVFHKE